MEIASNYFFGRKTLSENPSKVFRKSVESPEKVFRNFLESPLVSLIVGLFGGSRQESLREDGGEWLEAVFFSFVGLAAYSTVGT